MSFTKAKLNQLFVILTIECALLLVDYHVYAAPNNQQEKTADLSLLINETLKINNKSTANSGSRDDQSFRDDWTFDRVEYDLMDFLQELNARYRRSNVSFAPGDEVGATANLEGKRDPNFLSSENPNNTNTAATVDIQNQTTDALQSKSTTTAIISADLSTDIKTNTKSDTIATPVDNFVAPKNASASVPVAALAVSQEVTKNYNETSSNAPVASSTGIPVSEQQDLLRVATTSAANPVLPISLATGDHDISESTWQYGIFDRFTRPRSSTTPQPADPLTNEAGARLDVRSFNTDECGLRLYKVEPEDFPPLAADTDEVTKELSQRRQRPPLGSSFFSSHKKYHHTATGDSVLGDNHDSIREELDREKLLPPPFDPFGERINEPERLTNTQLHRRNYSSMVSSSLNDDDSDSSYAGTSSSSTSTLDSNADGEFNLSSRRQWLQQQLGNTLQMLGFNSTSQMAADILANQSATALSLRENMMKMSGNNKLGKSAFVASVTDPIDPSMPANTLPSGAKFGSGPVGISEKELNSRQDELKLEARVIGGNDAHLGDSPWSVSLQALVSRPGTGGVEYRHYCGGTIISEYYVLTAAHCLDFMVGRESRLFVVVGDLNWRMSAASMYGRRFGIEKLIIHGGYKSTAFGHDIGLIRTKESMKPLKVNGRYIINSVCLPERNVEHSGEAELVGWGLFSNRNEMADSLQIADVPILPRPLCVDLYKRRTGLIQWLIGIELITDKQICAGTFGRGICQGDSGSALVFNEKSPLEAKAASFRLKSHIARDQQSRATIIGIVAFGGIRRCSYQSLPGVYMQTSKYLDWILPRIQ